MPKYTVIVYTKEGDRQSYVVDAASPGAAQREVADSFRSGVVDSLEVYKYKRGDDDSVIVEESTNGG